MAGGAPEPPPAGDPLDLALRHAAGPDGRLPFDRFMDLALYAPSAGYYARPADPLGTGGDFYTAAHVSPLFGRAVGRRLLEGWAALGSPESFTAVELGPGDGTLAAHAIGEIDRALPAGTRWRYLLLDRSPARAERSFATASSVPAARVELRIATGWPSSAPFLGAVVANELLDAQPMRRFRSSAGDWEESYVRVDRRPYAEEFRPRSRPVPGPALPEGAPEGAILEISPMAEAIVRDVADALGRGFALFLDFGAAESHWTGAPGRSTLAGVRGHRAVGDPIAEAGRADLSAFVDFDRLRAAARTAGLRESAFRSQAEALGDWGIPALAEAYLAEAPEPAERLRRQLAVKNLLFGFSRFWAWELLSPG
jgi:SAM-dependent MidA family methyltransferase